ncbi:MAG TPA: 3'-5' exonuclease, partial [Acidobacteriaceae bacterium]|nr:3'-5' exonuclease [Acidobacteriaceae bacterium]
LACFLLTAEGAWRKSGGLNAKLGFPPGKDGQPLKARMGRLLADLAAHPFLESTLAVFLAPFPTAYTEDEWTLIRHCFVVLREAWAELQFLFSETGQVDFVEIAQIAQQILTPDPRSEAPFDSALRIADQIHHLLIDEFQDTSRNQHQLLSNLIALWPDRTHRTCFCVGDPMQSIYGFRDAEVELFERLKSHGLDLPGYAEPFRFESITLQANFRTTPALIRDLNQHFTSIFPTPSTQTSSDDVAFTPAAPTRAENSAARAVLHLDFTLAPRADASAYPHASAETTRQLQLDRILALVRRHLAQAEGTRLVNPQVKYRIAILGRTRSSLVRVAETLGAAQIPFRAVELVPLRERPEILDALALAHAFLNPANRRAWLGILRAPWCGLSLTELHALVSADDTHILATPVPTLLESRLPLLLADNQFSPASAAAANRLARVLAEAQNRRAEAATLTLGTWLESIWKALGGPATANAEARANLDLFWKTLDTLPSGEAALLSAELDSALDGLYALPDPAASSDHGVQLMTIHQSKGLEFEIVLIPELEAATRANTPTMISWLERGLPAGPESEGPTEFLIAPIQSKGSEAGDAKRWVDRIRRERETREMRRLLYVAATRAREELHLFARPCFTPGKTGEPTLAKAGGLLATAWPAFAARIEAEFQSWLDSQSTALDAISPLALAAQAELPSAPPSTRLYRLPAHFTPTFTLLPTSRTADQPTAISDPTEQPYERTPGGLYSRLQGVAIHAILEELTRLRQTLDTPTASTALETAVPKITALIRSRGLSPSSAASLAQESLTLARNVLAHPIGDWILTHHPHASAESRWSGLITAGLSQEATATLRHLRPDRIFLAPPHPSLRTGSGNLWWIIDYKTSHTHFPSEKAAQEVARRNFLEAHRAQHAAQIEAYAQLLRGLSANHSGGPIEIRAGLFYPRLLLFDSWPI